MEKKLIHFNEQAFNRQKDVFLSNLKILNEIADEYNQLGIGKISQKGIREIISGRFDDIETALCNAVEKDAKNSLVRDVLKTEILERFENFQIKVEQLVAKFQRTQERGSLGLIVSTPIEYFTISKEGRFEILDETWEKVKERCSNYIHNEKELKIHEALQKLAEASNEFMSTVSENVRLRYFPPNEPSDFLVLNSEGLYEPDPENNYQFLIQ